MHRLTLAAALMLSLSHPVWAQSPSEAPGPIPETASFTLDQAAQNLELEKKEYETLYRTDLVPDTCYRSETQGTRADCRTEYDQQCRTELSRQCGFRTHPVCSTIPRTVCTQRQICTRGGYSPHPSSPPRPRPPVCRMENRCQTVHDQVCRNESRYECWSFPQTYCQNVPRQVCVQVPNIVQVPYACTKPVQIAVGQRLKMQTHARIVVRFENFDEIGALTDRLTARLQGNEIRLSGASGQFLYRVTRQVSSEQVLSETARMLNVEIQLRALKIETLQDFASIEIRNGRIFQDRIEFELSRMPEVPFRGRLELKRDRALARDRSIIDADFDSTALTGSGPVVSLPLRVFGAETLKKKRHRAQIRLSLDGEALRKDAVNVEVLNQVKNRALETAFENCL